MFKTLYSYIIQAAWTVLTLIGAFVVLVVPVAILVWILVGVFNVLKVILALLSGVLTFVTIGTGFGWIVLISMVMLCIVGYRHNQ